MDKPGKLGLERDKWNGWRFRFENYMACIDSHYAPELDQVTKLDTPSVIASGPSQDEVTKRPTTLYAILASLLQGKDLQIVKQTKALRNGYEAWRLLVKEKERQVYVQQLNMNSQDPNYGVKLLE